ncbi:MAG: PINc/VapC family ATPase [Candidatus Nanoarchaeia archaeon]
MVAEKKNYDRVVPDTSVIIEGILSKMIEQGEVFAKTVIIHEAVLAELESQANKNRETGILGLEEVQKLRALAEEKNFMIEYKGARPGDFEIKFAKSGEIDSLIRELALKEKATLMTADIVQSKVAEAKGIPVFLYEFPEEEEVIMLIEKYFSKETMSIHLKEGCAPMAKIGMPGSWKYTKISEERLSKEDMQALSKDIVEKAKIRPDSFFEMDRKGSTVLQVQEYRIVIVRPPFADGYEITAVRPVKTLFYEEYALSDKLSERILRQAEGVLVAGAPGHGKSTFVQSLALKYLDMGKNVKTIESPRDLNVPPEVTQYNLAYSSSQEINDVLLLSRPDYTIFDEVRNHEDFKLFADLRLSGIGVLGVIHATAPIDAIQRFVGRIDLGIIPNILDTVLFVKNGKIEKAYSVSIQVKVPSGMIESDLSRPVVVIHDFDTGKLEYEIYSYGEETIVVPVTAANIVKRMYKLAEKQLKTELKEYDVDVEFISDEKCIIYLSKENIPIFLGRNGSNIESLEKKHSLHFEVKEKKMVRNNSEGKETLRFSTDKTANNITLNVQPGFEDKLITIYIDDDFFMSVKASKKGQIKMATTGAMGKILSEAIQQGKKIKLMG